MAPPAAQPEARGDIGAASGGLGEAGWLQLRKAEPELKSLERGSPQNEHVEEDVEGRKADGGWKEVGLEVGARPGRS